MYKIKQIPEDFIVKEIIKLKKRKNGEYSYFKLKKKNWNTIDVVRIIARKLKIPEKDIRYAGLKDKNAVTEQYISVRNIKNIKLKIKDVDIEKVGEGDEPIKLGGLDENYFNITVRDLSEKKVLKPKRMINYFDTQRFSNKNTKIGKALLMRDYKKLCELLELKSKGEIFKFDKKILRFALNSYQSYIFNEAVNEYIKKYKSGTLPMINFDTKFKNKFIENIYTKIMVKEKINKSDFILREMPFLIGESKERKVFVSVKNFKYRYGRDELNNGKIKCLLEFTLPKGSYGTLFVKSLFS